MMKLSPEEIEALAKEALTKFVERKEKRYMALKQKKVRLKREQMKQSELTRLATEVRGN